MNFDQLLKLGEREETFQLDIDSVARISKSYQQLQSLVNQDEIKIYGLHTHYGYHVKLNQDPRDFKQHQQLLLDYLRIGVGEPLTEKIVRRALRLQCLKASVGKSGIHPKFVQGLVDLSNAPTLPKVPCLGSLGASGDLVPMAHAIAPVVEKIGVLGPRDVIGSVNTNSMMASYAVDLFTRTEGLVNLFKNVLPVLLQSIKAPLQAFDQRLFGSRSPHPDTLSFLASVHAKYHSLNLQSLDCPVMKQDHPSLGHREPLLQHRYSFRVVPLIIDSLHKQLDFAKKLITEEALAVADNPVIESDHEVLHGGLFYTSSLAVAVDQLSDIQSKICELIDRQVLNLMDPELTSGLSDNLWSKSDGQHVKGLHQLASATLQRVKTLSTPTRAMSFSCESNNQDLVPCTMTGCNQLRDLTEHSEIMFKIYGFCTLRAHHLRNSTVLPTSCWLSRWANFELDELTQLLKQPQTNKHQQRGNYEFRAA